MNWYIRVEFKDGNQEGFWVFDVNDWNAQLNELIKDRWKEVRSITMKR